MELHVAQVVMVPLFALLAAVNSQSQGCTTASGLSGQCVELRECPSHAELVRQVTSDNASTGGLDILRKSICELKNDSILVCCPPAEEPRTKQSVLPSRCGFQGLSSRLPARYAFLSDWPWMVLLESAGPNGQVSLVCGGVLISDRYVLTAAHCVHSASGFTLQSVRIGELDISRDPDCDFGVCAPGVQSIDVEETIIHENYGVPHGCSACNDIALLRLNHKVEFTPLYVDPICLLQNLQVDLGFSKNEFLSERLWVTGWGTTDAAIRSDVLQQAQVTINNTLCAFPAGVYPDPNMVWCAGENKRKQIDICHGNSGGPMVIHNNVHTRNYVIGIVSRCGAAGTGGLYTNVNYYVPWIIKNLRD